MCCVERYGQASARPWSGTLGGGPDRRSQLLCCSEGGRERCGIAAGSVVAVVANTVGTGVVPLMALDLGSQAAFGGADDGEVAGQDPGCAPCPSGAGVRASACRVVDG